MLFQWEISSDNEISELTYLEYLILLSCFPICFWKFSHFGFYLSRKPSHPQLEAFIKHMSKGSAAQMDGSLSSLPRFPSHSLCEMGELTQTGEFP